MVYPKDWNCPYCKNHIKNYDKCNKCSFPELWHCPKCKTEIHDELYCDNCGFDVQKEKQEFKTITKEGKKELKTLGIYVFAGFWILVVLGVVFYINFNDKVNFYGPLVANQTFVLAYQTIWAPESVTVVASYSGTSTKTYYAELNTTENTWIVDNLQLEKDGYWDVSVQITRESGTSTIDKQVFIGRQCSTNAHCQEKYECSRGECVEHVPGPMDFLGEMGLI